MELVRTLGYEARHNWKPGKIVPIKKKVHELISYPLPDASLKFFGGLPGDFLFLMTRLFEPMTGRDIGHVTT